MLLGPQWNDSFLDLSAGPSTFQPLITGAPAVTGWLAVDELLDRMNQFDAFMTAFDNAILGQH